MHFRPNRTLARALVVSLLAHAALLVGVAPTLPVRIDAPAAAVSVVMSRKAPAGAPHPAVSGSGVVERPGTPPAVDVAKSAAKKIAVPDSPSRDHVVPAAPRSSEMPDPLVSSAQAGGAARRAPEGLPSQGMPLTRGDASPPPQEGVSADDVTHYRFALGVAAKRFKRYPTLAKERGWEGTAEVALDFRRLNAEPAISLVGSSGRKILDDQALEMIRQAVRQTDLPDRLKGKEFRIRQEVSFSIDDET